MPLRSFWAALWTLSILSMSILSIALPASGEEKLAAGPAFFQKHVEPLLKKHCHQCHAGNKPKAGLRLDYREGVLQGGDSGPAISVEDPETSLLLEAINYEEDAYEMPPKGKMPQEEIAVITKWIEMGAPWTPGKDGPPKGQNAHEEKHPPKVNEQTKAFWSFQKLQRPAVPLAGNAWVKTPIDAFLWSKLNAEGLSPAPPASKTALLRRAYYDLIGLPPTPKEVQAFLQDDSPDAFEKVVDRLLESPHYGEHWGRHWLDLVRYAETNSYERDGAKPFVWRYRDYVIQSFNEDKPYDQFVREQLAGDELDSPNSETITATGYYRLGIWDDEPADPKQALYDDLDDILSTTGQVFLGLTIGCARCHDHKLDPIPQADYYRMLAFFRNIRRFGVRSHPTVLDASVRMVPLDRKPPAYQDEVSKWEKELENILREMKKIEDLVRPHLQGGEKDDFQDAEVRVMLVRKRSKAAALTKDQMRSYNSLNKRRASLQASDPRGAMQVLCVKERGPSVPETHILIRGNAHAEGDVVAPGFPSVLDFDDPKIEPPPAGAKTSGRRRMLADWIASDENPLTARVIANRIWQYHFGRGIVRSSSDFGFQGDAPTHPRLLDWLANELVDGGWKMKQLHKKIMLSNAYQMSSIRDAKAYAADPQNHLFWRFDGRRLKAEEVRDSILAVNGSLNREKMYGPSIYEVIPREVLAGQSRPGSGWGNSSPEDRARRSVYIHVKRSLITPMLSSFDFPEPDFTCPVRFVSTQPTQALGMLNSQMANEQAQVFAKYLEQQHPGDSAAQIELALRRVTQREPSEKEVLRGVRLLETLQQKHKLSPPPAMKQFCLTALNLNEFFYLD